MLKMNRPRTVLLCLVILAAQSCQSRGSGTAQYRTEKVDHGSITMTVTATGTLSAVITVQVGSQVSGVISRLYADFNSRVHKGQLLAELDPTSFQAQVEQRQADLTKAKVDAANAKITYERQRRLVAAGLTAQSELDAAQAAYEGAQAQVQQSQAALEQALTNVKYTKIISPIDGIVVDRQFDVGQTVAASFQAPTLFSIAQDLTKMQVQADVDQSDIGRVQVGQIARFSVDAYPEEEFRGRIAQIRLNATVTANVVSYPVMIEVPNPDERLRPKMTANVTIDVATVPDVIRIPNAALRFKPEADTKARPQATATSSRGGAGSQGGGQQPSAEQRAAGGLGRGGRGIGGAAGAFPTGQRQARRPQIVYTLNRATGKLTPGEIRTGITDGHYTQVVSGDLKVGDEIVVGLQTSKVEGPPPPGSSNPVAGGGARGGRGGR